MRKTISQSSSCITPWVRTLASIRTCLAKIERTTYHKCMKELEAYGYIEYVRSYSPVLGSLVYLKELG